MSSPAAAAPAGSPPKEGKKRRGVGRVLHHVRTVFRRGGRSKEKTTGPAASTAALMSPIPAPSAHPAPAAPPKQYEGATKIPRIQVHEERAKKLGSRFGLEIKPSEWHSTEGDRSASATSAPIANIRGARTVPDTLLSVPIRRSKPTGRREAIIRRNKENAPIIPSYDYSDAIILKRPGKTGGQDLVYKGKPRMRVRRMCHVCDSLITTHSKQARVCDNCGHRRCADCPRSPDAKKKYPYGYPNDEPGSTFRGVHACHECKKKFPPNSEDGTECRNCDHPKCSDCPRVKPRKVEPEPDPDILESLRLRMEALKTVDI
ncbi:hypothetical protein GGR54DRAFT_639825 [Hypoxylon sp. NC1633]|nr:hypothetical protein GGR54DRAFT_639825 [Hypoxylon sp. NC1633]